MKNITFKIYTLGCKVNQYDSFVLAGLLAGQGFQSVNNNADIAIVNSCAVTKNAISKSNRMINKARKENLNSKIVLMGCWPKVYGNEINKKNFDLVWEVGGTEKLANKIKNLLDLPFFKSKVYGKKKLTQKRARYFLKIQDGCGQYCAYCIIPYARGKPRSRPENEVINEIKKAVEEGFVEIVLSGIHLGQYGKDSGKKIYKGGGLLPLLKKAVIIKGLGRIRLSSIEVNELNDELLEFCLNSKKICNHFHIPLQSGSDKILNKMNRPYNKRYFLNKIKKIKEIDPFTAITTDIIVGFPGETDNDFKQSNEMAKSIGFTKVHIFPFSGHEKTPAFKMPDQISKKVIQDRARKLKVISQEYEKKYRQDFKNKEVDVVVEREIANNSTAGSKKITGKTEHYINVVFQKKDIIDYYENKKTKKLTGKIVKIKI